MILGMSEGVFWKTTLRKLMALYDVHLEIHGLKEEKASIEDVIF
ncbi:hypothetical protein [Peptoclostridium litorale]|nr:hypothetical protein [Peptoclostridium litorale]